MSRVPLTTSLLAAVLLTGCTSPPMGPTAMVLPAAGKPFQVFAQEQATCKQFAASEVDGGSTMSNLKQFGAAAVSTALGGGLGAAVRGQRGAEVGGGMGAAAGSAFAANGSARDQNDLQSRYNLAYTQCMFSHGNQLPPAARSSPRVAYGTPPGNSPSTYRGGSGYAQSPGSAGAGRYPPGTSMDP